MRVEKKADNMKYAIVGAGGHALEMTEVLLSLGTHQKEIDYFVEESFFDSASKLNTQSLDELVKKTDDYQIIIAIGDTSSREQISIVLGSVTYPTIVHPSAVVGSSTTLGIGNQISQIACLTSNVLVGNFCIINVNAGAGHGSVIGNFVNLAPGAALMGNVRIGNHCSIGPGALILSGVEICDHVNILPGSVVNKSILASGTYGGSPARKIG